MRRRTVTLAACAVGAWFCFAAALVVASCTARADEARPAVGDTCTLPVPMSGGRLGEHAPLRVTVRAMVRGAADQWPAAWVSYVDAGGVEQWLRALLVDLVGCDRGVR